MNIKQLSLFVENKPGALNAICQVLSKNNISIRTLSLADTQQFGILRLLVKEWELARDVLSAAGFLVKITDVVALPVADCPGGLAAILDVLDLNKISVEYMYAFISKSVDTAYVILRVEDNERAAQVLQESGVKLVSEDEVYGM